MTPSWSLANMRDVKLKKFANSHLKYRPGGELALINGLTKAILESGNAEVSASAANFDDLKNGFAQFTLADFAAAAGVSEAISSGCRCPRGRKAEHCHSLRCRHHSEHRCRRLYVCHCQPGPPYRLHRQGSGRALPRGRQKQQPGASGSGRHSRHFPGYGAVAAAGKDFWQIIAGIESGAVKALYVLGADLSMFPGNARIMQALAKLELLIVQDIFTTRVVEMAHVALPGAAAAEKSGSFTSTDNRVQCFTRAVPPPVNAREDWDILTELSNRLAFRTASADPAGILAEIKEAAPLYAGDCKVADGRCTGAVKSAAVLKSGAAFAPVTAAKSAATDGLKLLVGAIGFHNGTMSTRSENNITVSPEGYLEIHPEDASLLGVAAGDTLKVTSSAGSITGPARISARLQPGLLFAPSHFGELNANALLAGAANLVSVKVEKG